MSIYLERYAHFKHAIIDTPISAETAISIVIPCYNEPDILMTLQSLSNCDAPACGVEVIIIVNASEGASEDIHTQNLNTLKTIEAFEPDNGIVIHAINIKLPHKHAGVGLARKIGMDEACRRFEQINRDGIIVCFDADSTVKPNYLQSIAQHFTLNPKSNGCSIHFEHPLSGDLEALNYEAITAYELHLRYFINAQAWAGHPHAFQTVGSSMAARSSAYQKVGGMPKKQAGEDFYFLQKIIQLGNFTEIKDTTVIPSPRVSDRVPFGTGKAIAEHQSGNKDIFLTYDFNTFRDLKTFFKDHLQLYENGNKSIIPEHITTFLKAQNSTQKIDELVTISNTAQVFSKHFFNWFNAFMVMKYCHYCRDHFYPMKHVEEGSKILLQELDEDVPNDISTLLIKYRELDLN